MEIALKLTCLILVIAVVGVLIIRDMEKSDETHVAGWTLNIPASVTAGALALLFGSVAAYFLF